MILCKDSQSLMVIYDPRLRHPLLRMSLFCKRLWASNKHLSKINRYTIGILNIEYIIEPPRVYHLRDFERPLFLF